MLAGVEDFPYANDKVGPGTPPIRTEKGWLVFTHGVDLDPERGKNGWEDTWKKRYCAGMGFRTNVIFPTGAILEEDGTVKIYYGASDTVIALATANVNDLIQLCLKGE